MKKITIIKIDFYKSFVINNMIKTIIIPFASYKRGGWMAIAMGYLSPWNLRFKSW
jgi:hypothetical protein